MAALADRSLGAAVVAASDDAFGPKELLIKPGPVDFVPGTYDHKGEVVDGWETRRRRTPGYDWAVVRLGLAGVVTSIDVDTTSFAGNSPTSCRIEACGVEGNPSPDELTDWRTIVPRTPLKPDAHNLLVVEDQRRWTHLRLCIEPDGGVGRLRVEGSPVPDPRPFDGLSIDLAGLESGARVISATDSFYGSPEALLRPDLPRSMGEGWETRRRRDGGHDAVLIKLGAAGVPRLVEIDTTHFVYNASSHVEVWYACHTGDPAEDELAWQPLLPRVALQPDARHRFRVDAREVTHVRLDAYPDGGLARFRVLGTVTPAGRSSLGLRWFNSLPPGQLMDVLSMLRPIDAAALIAERPVSGIVSTWSDQVRTVVGRLVHGA